MGRPSSFTQETADEICERIATTPRGIDIICDDDDSLPSARTVHRWLDANEEFRQSYLRARERQADLLFDQALHIADTPIQGEKRKVMADGKEEVTKGDMIEHRRLQVDTRLRMAGKLAPKKYGEKHLIGQDPDNPLPAAQDTGAVAARIAAILAAGQSRRDADASQ